MSSAAYSSVLPADVLQSVPGKTWRQFAVAIAVSLLVHTALLSVLLAPQYEEAQLAGGGASFGLSDGGLGTGARETATGELDQQQELAEEFDASEVEALDGEADDRAQRESDRAQQATPPLAEAATALQNEQSAQPLASSPASRQAAEAQSSASTPARKRPSEQRPSAVSPQDGAEAREQGGNTAGGTQADRGAASANTASPNQSPNAGKSQSGSGSGSGSAQSGSGSASRSNYTGIVTAHIRRKRRSHAAGAGSVILKLSIAPNGRIRDVEIYRSSGSTGFDRQAMRMARTASPYPKPPPGQGPVLVRIKGS